MTDHAATELAPKLSSEEEVRLAPPPDEENPALIDAKKAFVITLWSSALFIGVISVFILF